MNSDYPVINILIQQPALPKYRVPVFRDLNKIPEYNVTVLYSEIDNIKNVTADGFTAIQSKTLSINLPFIGPLYWDKAQISAVIDKRTDVAVLSWGNRYLSIIPALILSKFTSVNTVLWGHGYSKRNSNRLNSWFRFFITSLCDSILFYDPITCSDFKSSTNNNNCFTAPNTLDLEPVFEQYQYWHNNPDKLADFKLNNLLSNRDIILHVSRLDYLNRVDDLITAVSILKESIPDVLLILIGSGDEVIQNSLVSQIESLHCQNHILLLGALYEESELAPWYCSSDIFCYPSNIGLSLMHAFAYSLPVVIGDDIARCNPEIYAFEDEYNGLTYEQENIQSLVNILKSLIVDKELNTKLSRGAHNTAADKVSLTNMVNGFREAINNAVKRNNIST